VTTRAGGRKRDIKAAKKSMEDASVKGINTVVNKLKQKLTPSKKNT